MIYFNLEARVYWTPIFVKILFLRKLGQRVYAFKDYRLCRKQFAHKRVLVKFYIGPVNTYKLYNTQSSNALI